MDGRNPTEKETREILVGVAVLFGVLLFVIFLCICGCCFMGSCQSFLNYLRVRQGRSLLRQRTVDVEGVINPVFTHDNGKANLCENCLKTSKNENNSSNERLMEETSMNSPRITFHDFRSQIPLFSLPKIEVDTSYTSVYTSNSSTERINYKQPSALKTENPASLELSQDSNASPNETPLESNFQSDESSMENVLLTENQFSPGEINSPIPNNKAADLLPTPLAQQGVPTNTSGAFTSITESLLFVPSFIEINLDDNNPIELHEEPRQTELNETLNSNSSNLKLEDVNGHIPDPVRVLIQENLTSNMEFLEPRSASPRTEETDTELESGAGFSISTKAKEECEVQTIIMENPFYNKGFIKVYITSPQKEDTDIEPESAATFSKPTKTKEECEYECCHLTKNSDIKKHYNETDGSSSTDALNLDSIPTQVVLQENTEFIEPNSPHPYKEETDTELESEATAFCESTKTEEECECYFCEQRINSNTLDQVRKMFTEEDCVPVQVVTLEYDDEYDAMDGSTVSIDLHLEGSGETKPESPDRRISSEGSENELDIEEKEIETDDTVINKPLDLEGSGDTKPENSDGRISSEEYEKKLDINERETETDEAVINEPLDLD